MATATKKSSGPPPATPGAKASFGGRALAAIDEVYKFLASLKLAVISISSLAASLAFATWFESTYGTKAAQAFVYKSAGFSILLAFLAINIFCAASIRFPWKKRQTGFVVTHAGLLILILGSYVHFRSGDEGMVGMLEGETRSEMLRTDAPMFRLREVDPHNQETTASFAMPFDESGPFPWGGGQPRIRNIFDLALNRLTGGRYPIVRDEADVLSKPADPFKLVVKRYLPASTPDTLHEADPSGQPMARLLLQFKAPGMPESRLANADESDQWFKLDRRFYRTARSDGMPALVSFASVDRADYVDDFLKPPLDKSTTGVARFRYTGRDGKPRVFDFVLDTPADKKVPLPDSDLTVSLQKLAHFPTGEAGLAKVVGEESIPIAVFDVGKGEGSVVEHVAMGAMPMFPNVIPRPAVDGGKPPEALAAVHLMIPPDLDPKTSGRFGQVDVLAGPDQKLYYRVFGRAKDGKPELRTSGPIAPGKWVDAFGGGAAAMSINFQVADYLPAGVEKRIFRPLFLQGNQMDEAVPACLVELTVDGKTEEVWIQRSESLEAPTFRPVPVGSRPFEIAYDVDRKPLGFDLKLEDFEVGFEPGTEQATKFVSQVKVEDPAQGVKGREHTISMNEPMTHRGYTFYQMRYSPIVDPRTQQRTGQFQSVFQVGSNPGRPIIYAGSLLVVLGTFLQFYMRAGLFTDGGRREREQAAKKAGLPTPVEPAGPAKAEEDIL
ncbi:cytochrome c biogenesis protein ResB [Paludisphaera mucosa]|uniref:Cytochrome c biogenesis protein ResB n=1 Tax=Paludisphaera mucosa TaxID=3030827 RepID=A0ABT6F539_9BACT|nr:cytochrome c biogenesis protein ResB [Paludisphaera mucosa]MDG3002692.1 cytochrome c biogenesis protein ResB [Paludisphaera mucosa]